MNKLTRIQAETLIRRAWFDVNKYTLGSYRFGQSLWNLIPVEILAQLATTDLTWPKDVDFFYEQDHDVAISKFYTYFVEEI